MKKMFVVLIPVFLLLFIPRVYAARIACTNDNMSKMMAKAYKVTANYEFINDDGNHYFLIRITNVEKGIEVRVDGQVFKNTTGEEQIFEYKKYATDFVSLEIKMYSAYGYPCVDELLYTKRLNLPKYNFYSERSECIEYEEFPLCNKWYQGNIKDNEEFETKLKSYINSLNSVEENEKSIEGKNIFEKFIDFYVKNIVYTVFVTVIVITGLGYYIVKKLISRKNRVKVDFKR